MEINFNRILICLELNDTDSTIIKYATQLAQISGTQNLIFLYASNADNLPEKLAEKFNDLDISILMTPEQMEQEVATVSSIPKGINAQYKVIAQAPVPAIVEFAAKEDVDLIVAAQPVTSAQYSHEGSRLAMRLAYKSHCSLVSVPMNAKLQLRRMLTPVRNSDCSRRALQTAINLGLCENVTPTVFAHYVYPVSPGHARVGLSYEEFSEALKECAVEEVNELMTKINKSTAIIQPVFIDDPEDHPARLIAETIKSENVDAVFIGSRGRSGAAGIILGHVTETLIVASPVPVFAIKKKGDNVGLLKALGMLM